MLRNRLLPAFVALGLAACGQPDSALRIDITVDDQSTSFASDCLRVTLLDGDGDMLPDGSATFAQPANGAAVVVVRKQSGWPEEVTVRVDGLVGPPLASGLTNEERPAAEEARCAEAATLRLNARADKAAQRFPTQGLTPVAVTLARSSADTDADHDGYASNVGGAQTRADCDDAAATTHYGQAQLCTTFADTDCDDLPGCDDSTCFGLGLCVAPPTRLVLVGGGANNIPLAMPQPSRTQVPLNYQLQNASGLRVAVRNTPVAVTVDNPDVELVNTVDGGGYLIPAGASDVTVTLRTRVSLLDTVNVQLSAEPSVAPDAGAATANLTLSFKPTDVARLVFVDAGAIALEAGECTPQPLRLELQDANNNPTMAPTGGLAVSFSTPGTINDGAIFDSASCAAPLTARTLAAGETSVSLHLGYDTYGSYVAQATAPGVSTAYYPFTVNAGPASRLAFFSNSGPVSSLPLDTGVCSPDGALFVGLRDAQGNPTTHPTPLTLNLAVTGGLNDLRFFQAPCDASSGLLSFTLPANTTSIPLYATGNMSTSGDLTATMTTPTAGIAAASVGVSVGAGAPTTVELFGAQETVTAGSCSSAGFTLRLKDMNGNTVRADGGVRVTLADPGSDLTFFVDGGCFDGGVKYVDIAGGASEQVFAFRATAARTFDLGPPQSSVPAYPTYTGVVTGNVVLPGAATSVLLSPDGGSIPAGPSGCTPYTVEVRDAFLNPTPYGQSGPGGGSVQRTLSISEANISVSSNVACGGGSLPTIAADSATGTMYLSSTVAGTYSFTSTPQSLGLTSNAVALTVTPGTPSLVIRDAGAPWVVAAGECRVAVLSNEDVYGNPVTLPGSITVDGGDGTQLFSASNCGTPVVGGSLASAGSTTPLWIRPTRTGGKLVTAGTTASLSLEVRPGATAAYTFDGAFPAVLTAGHCAGPVTLSRYDAFNNLTDGGAELVSLLSSPTGRLSFFDTAGCSAAVTDRSFVGGATATPAFFVRATVAGSAVLTAASSITQVDAGVLVVADAGHHLSFVAQPTGPLVAGSCSTFTVEQRDGFENRVTAPLTVSLTSTAQQADGGNAVLYASGACSAPQTSVVLDAGIGAFNFQPEKVSANISVTAATGGSLAPAVATYAVQPGTASVLVWQPAPLASPSRFACASAGAVQTTDAYGNLVGVAGSKTVTWAATGNLGAAFYGDPGCAAPLPTNSLLIPDTATSSLEVYFAATGSSGSIQASAAGFTPTAPQMVTVSGAPGVLTVSPATAFVEASACVPYVLTRTDALGVQVTNGVTGFTVTTDAGVTLHSDSACSGAGALTWSSTLRDGGSTVFYVRGRSVNGAVNVPLQVVDTFGGSDSGTAVATALPLVRRGRCDLDGVNEVRCELAPALPNQDISRSLLLFSSTKGGPAAGNANVACRLDNSADASVVCARTGSGTGQDAVDIEYQVMSWGRGYDAGGVSVQHYLFDAGSDFSFAVTPVASLSDTFLLFSSRNAGGQVAADDFPTAYLESTSSVRVEVTGGETKEYALQVVSWNGAQVNRGATSLATGADGGGVSLSLPGVGPSNSFLLHSVRNAEDDFVMCKRHVRSTVLGTTGAPVLAFSRGAGSGDNNCVSGPVDIRWELITLPSTVVTNRGTVQVSNGSVRDDNFGGAIVPVLNKSVAFLGGQGPGGQSGGESGYFVNDDTGDRPGPFHALVHLVTDKVQLTCSDPSTPNGRVSQFNPIVLQFDP